MTLPPTPADIRTHLIRTAPDFVLRETVCNPPVKSLDGTTYPRNDVAARWADEQGIAPLTCDEIKAELQRRDDRKTINARDLPGVLAALPDYYFIPTRDTRVVQSLCDMLFHDDYKRMTCSPLDMLNERKRRGLPLGLTPPTS